MASLGGDRPPLPGATGLRSRGSRGVGSGGGDHGGGLCVWHSVVLPKEPPPPSACGAPGPGQSLQASCCSRVAAGLEDCGIMDLPWGAGL